MPRKTPEKSIAEEHLRSLNASWKNALTCPLPSSISYQLLDTLRAHVLAYLDFVTRELVQDDPALALAEIQRAADRLTRIVAMTSKALDAAREDQPENAQVDIKQLRKLAEQRIQEAAGQRKQRRAAKT